MKCRPRILRARLPLLRRMDGRSAGTLAAAYRAQLDGARITVPPECDPRTRLSPVSRTRREPRRLSGAPRCRKASAHSCTIRSPSRGSRRCRTCAPAVCPVAERVASQVVSLPLASGAQRLGSGIRVGGRSTLAPMTETSGPVLSAALGVLLAVVLCILPGAVLFRIPVLHA